MIRVISSFADGPVNFHSTGPAEDQIQKLISSTVDYDNSVHSRYTAISRKVVEKSARDNPERYCGWFLVHCFSKKFQTMAREAMDVCLRVLKV